MALLVVCAQRLPIDTKEENSGAIREVVQSRRLTGAGVAEGN